MDDFTGVIVLLGILIFFIMYINSKVSKDTSNYNEDNFSYTPPKKKAFNIILGKDMEELSSENREKFEFIKVFIDGIVNVPYDNYNTNISVSMFDITNGKEEPIICLIESMQYKESLMFHYSRNMKMPYKGTVINKHEFIRIPTMFLQFPRSGNRKIEIIVEVSGGGRVLEKSKGTLYHTVLEQGYLEALENEEKFEEKIVKAAVYTGSIDGYLDYNEKRIIKKWIEKESYSSDITTRLKKEVRLEKYIEEAEREIKLGYNIYELLDDVYSWMSEKQKYQIYELCLKVAGADGVASTEELDLLQEIAEILKLDRSKYQAMIEKELPIMMHESSAQSDEEKIGITRSMSKDEIKKHLMNEYRKWNRRVSNSNPQIREQAEEMIKIIAELRKKYR